MAKFIFSTLVSVFWGQIVFSQSASHIEGGRFTKRIEYNVIIRGETEADHRYNLDGKSTLDRIFFGETNSLIEFVFDPSFEAAVGLRIVKNSHDNSYRLETMLLPDSQDIVRQLERNTTPMVLPNKLLAEGLIPLEKMQLIKAYNEDVLLTQITGEIYKPYRPAAKIFRVSNQFAEALCDAMVSLIDTFKAEGVPPLIFDGYQVTFRCVVEAEVWTLTIHMPQNRALQLSDLCRKIIADGIAGQLNESNYLKSLDKIVAL